MGAENAGGDRRGVFTTWLSQWRGDSKTPLTDDVAAVLAGTIFQAIVRTLDAKRLLGFGVESAEDLAADRIKSLIGDTASARIPLDVVNRATVIKWLSGEAFSRFHKAKKRISKKGFDHGPSARKELTTDVAPRAQIDSGSFEVQAVEAADVLNIARKDLQLTEGQEVVDLLDLSLIDPGLTDVQLAAHFSCSPTTVRRRRDFASVCVGRRLRKSSEWMAAELRRDVGEIDRWVRKLDKASPLLGI